MRAPSPPPAADWIVCESTYGNREHGPDDLATELAAVLRRVLGRGGVAIIPAFAVGRAQLLLHLVATLQGEGAVPKAPMYLNSPMATDVTSLYARYPDQHRLDPAALAAMRENTRFVNSIEESKALNRGHGPMVIVAGSGMVTGGRVLHHLLAFAGDPRNAIVLCGYQAGGTRGAALAAGERSVRVYGQDVAINAEVVQLTFEHSIITYREVLEIFFVMHDPTTLNRQGADVGEIYRSVVFYNNDEQKQIAEEMIKGFAAELWSDPIVTQLVPLEKFWPADDYMQDYYNKNPQAAYCQVVIDPKIQKLRQTFAARLQPHA